MTEITKRDRATILQSKSVPGVGMTDEERKMLRDKNKIAHDLHKAFCGDPDEAWGRAVQLIGQTYDTWGAVLSATCLARSRQGWFYSQLIAHALAFGEPHEFSPGMLAAVGTKTSA